MTKRQHYRNQGSYHQQAPRQVFPQSEIKNPRAAASSGLLRMSQMLEGLLDRTPNLSLLDKTTYKQALADIADDQAVALRAAHTDDAQQMAALEYQTLTQIYPEPPEDEWPNDIPSTRSYACSTFEGKPSNTLDLEMSAWLGNFMNICKSKSLSHEQALELMARHMGGTAMLTFSHATELPNRTLTSVVAHLETVYGQVLEPDEAHNAIANLERGKDTLTDFMHKLTHLSKMATKLLPMRDKKNTQSTLIRTHLLRGLDPRIRFAINDKMRTRRLMGYPDPSCATLCKEAQEMEKAYGLGPNYLQHNTPIDLHI